MFIDSHCHLDFSAYDFFLESKGISDATDYSPKKLIARAELAKVRKFLTIGTMLSDVEPLTKIAESFPSVSRTIGIYPEYAKQHLDDFSLDEIENIFEKVCSHPKTVALGEIGLDYHLNNDDVKEQKQIFRFQLGLAEKFSLPVSIHTRDAWPDTLDILAEFPNVRCVIHCFSGEPDFTEKVLKTNHYIGIGGVVTFKKSTNLKEAVKKIPLDRLLLETDAPFLAPDPFRGKVNEPAFVFEVAKKIAELKNISWEEVETQTMNNFFNLFSKAN